MEFLKALSQLSELSPWRMLGSPNGCVSGNHPETARTSKSLPKPNNFTGKDPDKQLHLDLGVGMDARDELSERAWMQLPAHSPS